QEKFCFFLWRFDVGRRFTGGSILLECFDLWQEKKTAMRRRDLLKGAALLPALSRSLAAASSLTQEREFGAGWSTGERLDQGPFDIDQDQGWQTILFTTPSELPLRNFGLGFVGYTWEESGPSLAARAGRES